MPDSAITPAAIRDALGKYIDFGGAEDHASGPAAPTGMRLGLLLSEVEAMYGPAVAAEERMEGKLHVSVRTYARPEGRITAELVEGVVIRFHQSAN